MKKQRTVTFNHNPLLKRELPAWRPRIVMLALMGCSLALVGRALYLQGVNDDFLQAKGASRAMRACSRCPPPAAASPIATATSSR